MVIIVTGSVGTGKTIVAKKLAKKLGYSYVDVTKLIKENGLYDSVDKKNDCVVVDIDKLNKFLIEIIKLDKKLVIDSHMSHFLPKKYVDLCIVTKCELKTLEGRLKKRKYSKSKIKDNLDCEIFNVCYEEAISAKHKVFVISTTKRLKIEAIAKDINKIMRGVGK